MIEAMEQQIINSINGRWTKDKSKRKEIDIHKLTECFRVICSSRSSVLFIIDSLKYWVKEFKDELLNFPTTGIHDDMVDSVSLIAQIANAVMYFEDLDDEYEPLDWISGY